ncbi:Uncharacterised protein [Mycobacteroides abscessus subsp. abscessus]|nr:Uncharacterised protein [Mycobacteroides abscessus subsp. abscessus]
MLVGGVLDSSIVQVVVESRLVDRIHRSEAHRDRRELPELRHQPWVRVRGQAATLACVAVFLTEPVHAVGADSTFEECACIDSGRRVALDEDLVATARMVGAAEEVVEADLVERCRRRIRGDVPAHSDAWPLRPVNHDRGVPAEEVTEPTFDVLVAGEPRLTLGGNRVDVVGRRQ